MSIHALDKFNPDQAEWFMRFYNAFNETEIYPDGLDGEDVKSQQLRHKLAKTFAQVAVFEMNGLASRE
jgi:hypothetical protein